MVCAFPQRTKEGMLVRTSTRKMGSFEVNGADSEGACQREPMIDPTPAFP
jgi:hypothetical protein